MPSRETLGKMFQILYFSPPVFESEQGIPMFWSRKKLSTCFGSVSKRTDIIFIIYLLNKEYKNVVLKLIKVYVLTPVYK